MRCHGAAREKPYYGRQGAGGRDCAQDGAVEAAGAMYHSCSAVIAPTAY